MSLLSLAILSPLPFCVKWRGKSDHWSWRAEGSLATQEKAYDYIGIPRIASQLNSARADRDGQTVAGGCMQAVD